ncbi:NDMA-dependent alcohol dehydrogenase [Actinoplanes sp. CA-054009]
MKTKAAVLFETGKPFEIVELELDEPREEEILVRFVAAGLCHSELHYTSGDISARVPFVGGHEASGVVEAVGSRVTRVKPGDHVVTTFVPSDGTCQYCSTGRQSLCVLGATLATGELPQGGFRMRHGGTDVGGFCMIGAFSERSVLSQYSVVRIDPRHDLMTAALFSCGIPTGWGTATKAADVEPGDVVVVFGAGGIGMNAVQGARYSGASEVVVVDPVKFKRDTARHFGATYTYATAAAALDRIGELTGGAMADKALVTVGQVDSDVATAAFDAVGKSGTVVITGLAKERFEVRSPSDIMLVQQKTVRGAIYGSLNPQYDIPRLLQLHRTGDLRTDGLLTRTYTLNEVNDGYRDLVKGRNIRGVVAL